MWMDADTAAAVEAGYRSGVPSLTIREQDGWTYVYDFEQMARNDVHLEHGRVSRPIRMAPRSANPAA